MKIMSVGSFTVPGTQFKVFNWTGVDWTSGNVGRIGCGRSKAWDWSCSRRYGSTASTPISKLAQVDPVLRQLPAGWIDLPERLNYCVFTHKNTPFVYPVMGMTSGDVFAILESTWIVDFLEEVWNESII